MTPHPTLPKRSWLRTSLAAGLAASMALGAVTLLPACTDDAKAVPCATNSDCDDGLACVEKECKTVECLSSAECDVGEHCAPDFTCTTGCEESADCMAGETCSDGTCEAYGCRDTHLDCGYGEFCDTTTGLCYPDDSGTCGSCDPGSDANCFAVYEQGPCSSAGNCPGGQECFVAEYDDSFTCSNDSQCDADEQCLSLNTGSGTIGPHCTRTACYAGATYPACDPSAEGNDCSRGFQCQDLGDGSGVCFGDCAWLKENGYL